MSKGCQTYMPIKTASSSFFGASKNIPRGRASLPHWSSGVKACMPPALPPAAVALRAGNSEGLKKCDAGKGDECPNDPQLQGLFSSWACDFWFVGSGRYIHP